MLPEMKILADESVDFGIILGLRQKGFEVISVLESYSGYSDTEVLKIGIESKCLLITEDKDFGELTYRMKLKHLGILLIRLSDVGRKDRIDIAVKTIQNHFDKLNKNFTVLNKKGLRIKKSHA
jgi:predicted nuclease of predicted toxin-antitoxin system